MRQRKTATGLFFLMQENALRLELKESREGFCRRERGMSFQIEGPKTENAQEPTDKFANNKSMMHFPKSRIFKIFLYNMF